MTSMGLRTEQRQQHALSPRLQHAVRLLQLSSLDFAQEVKNALGRNPFLEIEDTQNEADEEALSADGERTATLQDDMPEGDTAFEHDNWQADGLRGTGASSSSGESSALDRLEAERSLAGHLHGQLNLLPLAERDRVLAKALVESLDDDGYLRLDLAELTQISALTPPADADELQIALRRVQSLEPAGVGARSVAECLLLQLPAIECAQQRALAQRIVNEQLDRLAAKDTLGLARRLERTAAEIEAVCERIRHLDPRPGWRYGASHIRYITPDVIVKKVRGVWSASLNPAIVPKVRLNRVYAELFQRHRSAQHGELATHLQEARWTVGNVEQRFATILGVAQAIVKRQQRFLDYGPMAMKPLGLRAIADELGLHESTVSRVTNNKYMATPVGVFELKHFFSRAMHTASGAEVSGTAIRGLIKDMIEAEARAKPLSDAEIARQLARQGLVVARRTVTKYRQTMGIEAVDRRTQYCG
jgi:RNA polymerase sigma-54 factor